jgi:hypothetical protein
VQVGISWRKHSRKPLNFYKKLVTAAMRRDWGTRLAGEPEYNSRMKKHAEISKEATLKVKKEEPIPEKLEEEHIKSNRRNEQEKHVKREAIKGLQTNRLGSNRLRRSIRQEKTIP